MNLTYELIRSEIDHSNKVTFTKLGATDYGKKFSLIMLKKLSGLRVGKLADHYTEGGGDHQIDGIYFNDEGDELVVNILTCKFNTNNDTIPDKDVTDFLQVGVQFLLFGEEKSPDINDRIKDLREDFRDRKQTFGNKYSVTLKFISPSQSVLSPNGKSALSKFISELQENGVSIDYEELNSKRLSAIFSPRSVKNTPIPIKLSGKSYYSLTGREGFICRLPVGEIIKMYYGFEGDNNNSYPGYGDFLFVDNVRKNLGLEKKINLQIYDSATQQELANDFEYFNNGITIIYTEKTGSLAGDSPVVFLKGLRVVNGCQTVSTLMKAKEDENLLEDSIYVNCRFIKESDEKTFVQSVITYTNSQNAITDRDLHSNDQIQYEIQAILDNLGYFYERKLNEFLNEQDDLRIDALEAAQAYMCCELKKPSKAKQNKKRLFGDQYSEVFKDNQELPYKLLISFKTLEFALQKQSENRLRKNKTKKQGKSPRYRISDLVISHGSYHIATLLYDIFFIDKTLDELKKIARNFNYFKKFNREYHKIVQRISAVLKTDRTERDKIAPFFKQNDAEKFFATATH